MNIPDEYWTTEVPTEPGFYAFRKADAHCVGGAIELSKVVAQDGKVLHIYKHGQCILPPSEPSTNRQWCRLTPAAKVERLKAENEKLRGWIADAYTEGWRDGSVSIGRDPTGDWGASTARARLEGRFE